MPFESQVVIGAIILVFLFFMAMVAWAERRAGGSFDDASRRNARTDSETAPAGPEPAFRSDERKAA